MDTREQLIVAAGELVRAHGLAGLSMRKVGARCGISAAAIYRHFPDKDALLACLVQEAFGTFMGALLEALTEADALTRFRTMGRQYFRFAVEYPAYYQLIFMTNCDELGLDRVDEATRTQAQGTFRLLMDRVAECQAEGIFQAGDAEAQAAYVWSCLHGAASLYLTGNIDDHQHAVLVEAHIASAETALRHGTYWARVRSSCPG